MPNTINYAQIFNQVLDEKYAIMPRTAFMEANSMGIQWQGGKTVNIPKLALQGLGDVVGCNVPNGDYTFAYETHSLQWDRGRTFSIPRYAVSETNFTLTAGNIIATFMKDNVVPEVDKLRIGTVAQKALTAGNVVYEGASVSATPLADLLTDIASVQDKIGEDVQLYILISNAKKSAIMKSAEITKYLNVRDFEVRSVNMKVDAINDAFLIGCPSSYMKSEFEALDGTTVGEENGGVVPADDATNVNWIIVARDSVLAVGYPRVEKVITPDENQSGDCWKIMFRMYHGLFVLENKIDGILANFAGEEPTQSV